MTTPRHAALAHDPANLLGGEWVPLNSGAGRAITSYNPASPSQAVWSGVPDVAHVHRAVAAARRALPAWAAWGFENRARVLRRFAELCKQAAPRMTDIICDETGKVLWESKAEAGLLSTKVDITLDPAPTGGLARVSGFEFDLAPQRRGRCWFKPHGVMAVIGPFNFPAHLPNGHIVPALAMGNTVVFKPSDKTPGVGQLLAELLNEALIAEGAPARGAGVVNLVQGAADVATALTTHDDIDGIAFTGSWPVGRRILEANLDRPGRITALEMGGNNAAVVMDDADLKQAAIEVVRCAFNTTGQRCTCTRRAIVHERVADRFIAAVARATGQLVVGMPRATHPVFMGPIISRPSRDAVLEFQQRAAKAGARVVVEASAVETPAGGHFISPGVLVVDRFTRACGDARGHAAGSFDAGCDTEVFGPLLRIAVVKDLDAAIEQVNATDYGLAASIFTRSQPAAERFLFEARAGCINVNAGTAGASSKLPFGGLGLSGNHRPAGSFALDYCAYPVAGMLENGPAAQVAEGMTWDDRWL